jgi:uncharacterized Zn-finger protein
MADQVVPHFHNDLGVQVIEIGAKKFMCMGALPPQDHPHVFCDMGDDAEYVCPYCSTPYRHKTALAPNKARPEQTCVLHALTFEYPRKNPTADNVESSKQAFLNGKLL